MNEIDTSRIHTGELWRTYSSWDIKTILRRFTFPTTEKESLNQTENVRLNLANKVYIFRETYSEILRVTAIPKQGRISHKANEAPA